MNRDYLLDRCRWLGLLVLLVVLSGCHAGAARSSALPAAEPAEQVVATPPATPASERQAPPEPQGAAAPPEQPDVPIARQVEHDWMSLAEWRSRHEQQLNHEERTQARVVFIGDSITEGWGQSPAYRLRFEKLPAFNLGIGGDQTQHVLWRIEQGALTGVKAGLAVILIGVNNLGNGHTPEETLRGIVAVVDSVRQKLPQANVLLLSILPAGETEHDELRRKIVLTNALIAQRPWPERVSLADVGHVFVSDGRIEKNVMADFLHPTNEGYERLTDAVGPLIGPLIDEALAQQ